MIKEINTLSIVQSRNQENNAKIGEGNGVLQNLKKGDGRQCKEGRHKIWGEGAKDPLSIMYMCI